MKDLSMLEKEFEKNPEDWKVQLKLIEVYIEMGDLARGLSYLDQLYGKQHREVLEKSVSLWSRLIGDDFSFQQIQY